MTIGRSETSQGLWTHFESGLKEIVSLSDPVKEPKKALHSVDESDFPLCFRVTQGLNISPNKIRLTGFWSKRHQYGISTLKSQTFLSGGSIRGARCEAAVSSGYNTCCLTEFFHQPVLN